MMLYKQTVLTVGIALGLLIPVTAHSDDVDDLKAAYEQVLTAINNQDLDTFMALFHDEWMGFGLVAPFPTDGKAAWRQVWQMTFENHERTHVVPMNLQYRVMGTTGVVIGHVRAAFKPKDGPVELSFARVLVTWTKADEKWLVVATHLSRIPSGD